ncbi:ABC transporter substrate-binding protein [Corynebacterium endometrii]|uniref:Maltose-binding periplasmic protein n=1 Tax=Corynebacterium endometrii TaxID=2488819 RepID=A0A4P7QK06_9CORY|nr:ABC transporter substrate-binding protein [Corynebacterium endometrii]QCB29137.1 Maltose-binding periplasmic protein precursor [Corynebacterium endometrii]
MKRFNRFVSLTAATVLAAGSLVACSDSSGGGDDAGSVYFLNFKPEQEAAYQKIAEEYTAETGTEVKVVTAASGSYEQTLKAEIGKSEAPTLFQVNGPAGLITWKDYMADLTGTEIANQLNEDVPALTGDNGEILGVPFAVEGFGLIYNEEIFDKYFATDGAKVASTEEIDSFDKLKEVAEDMQSKKDELGIEGTFAATSLATGEDWRWQTHLANAPIWNELEDQGVEDSTNVEFKYNEEYKNLFDLYLNNSTVEPSLTPSKNVTDSMAEFAQGKVAMVQNGNWAWSQISEVDGNVVKEDKIKFMPMYMGLPNEGDYGLNVGTENYLAINANASEEDQQATKDFVDWLFTSDAGKTHVVEDLGFIAPFSSYTEEDTPADPLAQQVQEAISNDEVTTIPWAFQYFPSQQFKDDFGQALAQYASGNMEWDQVVSQFSDSWTAEKETNWGS